MPAIPDAYLRDRILSPYFSRLAQSTATLEIKGVLRRDSAPLAGGLSCGQVWRIGTGQAEFALRICPSDMSLGRLVANHAILQIAAEFAFPIPELLINGHGDSWLEVDGNRWELMRWLPGQPVDINPSDAQLEAAMALLARWHESLPRGRIAEKLSAVENVDACKAYSARAAVAPSGLLKRRREWQDWRRWLHDPANVERMAKSCSAREPSPSIVVHSTDNHDDALSLLWETIRLHERIRDEIDHLLYSGPPACELVLSHGDLHSQHLLFEGDRVTGWIDWESPRLDSRAADLGRLLGSWFPGRPEAWNKAFDYYRRHATLRESEAELARVYDRSGTMLAALRWMQWLTLEETSAEFRRLGTARWRELVKVLS